MTQHFRISFAAIEVRTKSRTIEQGLKHHGRFHSFVPVSNINGMGENVVVVLLGCQLVTAKTKKSFHSNKSEETPI